MKMSIEYPCVYFEKDGKCRKFSDDVVASYCVLGPCQEQKLSNADRIRAMSDEKLCRFLNKWDAGRKAWKEDPGETMRWLLEPAEEDT